MLGLSLLAFVATLAAAAPSEERVSAPRARATQVFSLRDRTHVRLEFTTLVPRANMDLVATTETRGVPTRRVHRIFMDAARGLFYGYDVGVEPGAAPGSVVVTLGELSDDAARDFQTGGWRDYCRACEAPRRISSAQRFPKPQPLKVGETLSIDLLADEATGARVTDRLVLGAPRRKGREVLPPQDFVPEDVWLQLLEAKLYVNGEPVYSDDEGGVSVQGELVWVGIPGKGRIFFSLVPRAGYPFEKGAVLTNDRIKCTLGADVYEWIAEGPIVTAGPRGPFEAVQSWYLWILHDAGYPVAPGSYVAGAGFDERAENRLKQP